MTGQARTAGSRHQPAEGMIIIRRAGGWYVALQHHQSVLSAALRTRAEAEAWREAKAQELRHARGEGLRPCLRCRKSFESAGRHNRLCPHCSGFAASLPRQMAV